MFSHETAEILANIIVLLLSFGIIIFFLGLLGYLKYWVAKQVIKDAINEAAKEQGLNAGLSPKKFFIEVVNQIELTE